METLKIEREKKGLTQTQLGRMVGVTGAQISRYEAGIREPSLTMLVKFAAIFHVSTDYLLGIEKVPVPETQGRNEPEVFDLSKRLTPSEAKKFYDLLEWYISTSGQGPAAHR